jgi:hypothetical protein
MLHINLVVIGSTNKAINQFKATFSSSEIARPVMVQKLKPEDRATQLSYILKFTTYHRPFAQRDWKKGPAVSLNFRDHCALITWMAQWKFQDFMFMFNARRVGATFVSSPRSRLTF